MARGCTSVGVAVCVCVCARARERTTMRETVGRLPWKPVISHQSQFTWLTGANGPHAASLAAGILIGKRRAVSPRPPYFSSMQKHGASYICMHMCKHHPHAAEALASPRIPPQTHTFNIVKCFLIRGGDCSVSVSHLLGGDVGFDERQTGAVREIWQKMHEILWTHDDVHQAKLIVLIVSFSAGPLTLRLENLKRKLGFSVS